MNTVTEKTMPIDPKKAFGKAWTTWDNLFNEIYNWSKDEVIVFIKSIELELELLEPLEILAIIDQSNANNLLKENNKFNLLLQSEPNTVERRQAINYLKQEFGEVIEHKNYFTTNPELPIDVNLDINNQNDITLTENNPTFDFVQSLKSYDNKNISCNLDHETIEFLLKYRIDKLWNDVMSHNYDVNILRNETGGKYFTIIKNNFLEEYDKISDLEIPNDYEFKDNLGNLSQPNIMQKLITFRLIKNKKYGNWSGMGSGKTLSGILAGRTAKLKNTLIITFNANVEDWDNTIKNSFPKSSQIFSKQKSLPNIKNSDYNYFLFNYETFQSENIENLIESILNNEIDYIILDEVQLVKQRENDKSSIRRKVINKMIRSIEFNNTKKNKETYILAMSATPVINNLTEPKKILELIRGIKYNDILTFANINNALNIHRHLFINGIRFKPKYDINVYEQVIQIDGNHLINHFLCLPYGRVLALEQLLITDKLRAIKHSLKPGTMIYTHYVTNIVENIQAFVESNGFSVSVYTGNDKKGLQAFKNKECDILISSSPIGTGVDGLQLICNKLIVLSLPWTNSEYENLIGRLVRQGSVFNSVDVIIPQVHMSLYGDSTNIYSWDVDRMKRIKNKKTLANVALDGIIPTELLPTPEEMFKQSQNIFKKWIKRIEEEGLIQLNRESMLLYNDDGIVEIKQNSEISQDVIELDNNVKKSIFNLNKKTEKRINSEFEKINALLHKDDVSYKPIKTLTDNQKIIIDNKEKKFKIPVKINDKLTVYVDDESKIEKIREKYTTSSFKFANTNNIPATNEPMSTNTKKLPTSVKMGDNILSLIGKRYYDSTGTWWVDFEIDNDKLYSKSKNDDLNNILLKPIII